ncbi:MAG: hypothetical protein US54_C0062G0002 [Candidatus Roizmanbacteria bacterium GW2011_GWA2_37_7]|uniref:FAD-binding FR-type domain-containing protein n=1 Tax=Candidatus Roizmanbacteria bacterium GW2011_GWA2_37_7 TaxID=1618481 RepID=A0A0G0H3A0_9BACT|nr:MAG: hypothetical protein US54_C0062G0002 [Candidatus Roizmanbacteria bacterium GW2011_GWA2_37_7]
MLITHTATILKKQQLADTVWLLSFSYPDDPAWTFHAGQYMIFHLPVTENGHPARRLYSIASTPSQKDALDFIIELVPGGLGSEYIAKIQEGDTVTMQGPAGVFIFKPSKRDAVMLATGTGIAPMYSMIADRVTYTVKRETPNIFLFWGLKYKKDIYLKKELDLLVQENPNFQYSICLSREEHVDETHCMKGRITQGLEILTSIPIVAHFANISSQNELTSVYTRSILKCKGYKGQQLITEFDFYLCGSPHIVEALREDLTNKGVPKEQIYFEKFV